jgi:hypothetical protein
MQTLHTFPRLSEVGSSKEKMTPQSCSFSLKSSSRLLGGASRKEGSSRNAEGGLPTCGSPWYDPAAPAIALAPPRLAPPTLPATLLVDDEAARAAGGWDSTCPTMISCAPLGIERDWRFFCFSGPADGAVVALDASAPAGGADTAVGAGASL